MAGAHYKWVRSFNVTDPTTHEKGFTVYKVTYKAFPVSRPEEIIEVVVWKRYNDFKKLHKALSAVYFNLRRPGKFPEFAKAKIFGRFEESVIEERRKSALELLEFTSRVPILAKCIHMLEFFQGGVQIIEKKTKAAPLLLPSKVYSCPVHGDRVAGETSEGDTTHTESLTSEMEKTPTVSPRDGVEGEGEAGLLGGVWLHRQDEDEMEDNLEEDRGEGYVYDGGSDDDRTTFSEDSLPNTPLPQLHDISAFDPLADGGDSSPGPTSPTLHTSNSWLFHAMDLCADLKGDSPDMSHESSLANSSTDLSSDSGITLQLPPVPDTPPLDEAVPPPQSSEPAILPVSEDPDSSAAQRGLSRDQRSSMAQAYLRCIRAQEAADRDAQMDDSAGIIDSREETPNPSPQHGENRSRTVSGDSISKLVVRGEDDYLFKAGRAISMALQNEANGYYQAAFDSYKAGVSILLNGVAGETNKTRREAVRKKTAQYLMRAEDVYNNYLSEMDNSKRWESEILDMETDPSSEHLRGSIEELKNFKVLGVVDKVMLVLDMTSYQTLIIKVLNKCAVADEKVRTCIPSYCPHIVRLCRFIESDISIYLVLEYASGGKLWDYVSPYINQDEHDSQKLTPAGSKIMGTRSQSPQSPRTKSLSGQGSELPLKEGNDGEVQIQTLSEGDEKERRHLSADNWTRVREGKSDMDGTLTPPATGSLEAGPQKTDEEEINWLSASTSSSEKNLGGSSTPVKRMSGEPEKMEEDGLGVEANVGVESSEFDIVDEGESLNDLMEQSSSYQINGDIGTRNSCDTRGMGVTSYPPRFTLFSIDSVESPTEALSAGVVDKPVFRYANGGTHQGQDVLVLETAPSTEDEAKTVITEALEVIDQVNEISNEGGGMIEEEDFYNDQTRHVKVVDVSGFGVVGDDDEWGIVGTGDQGMTGRSQDSQQLSHVGNLSLGTAQEVEFSGPSDEKVTDSNDTKKSSKWDEFFKLNETEEADRERMDASDGGKSSTERKDKNRPKIPAALSEDELNVCVNPFEFDAARVAGSSEVTNTWVTVDDTSKPRRTSVEVMKEWPSSPTSSPSKSTPSCKGGKGSIDMMNGKENSKSDDGLSENIEKDQSKTIDDKTLHGTQTKVNDDSNKANVETESKNISSPTEKNEQSSLTARTDTSGDRSSRRDKRLPSLSSLFSYLDDVRRQQGKIHLPESCIRIWAAEIVVAVASLHACGIICRDLNPANILLAQGGHIRLTFFSQWKCIKPVLSTWAAENFYVAPEVQGLQPLTSACDWWSFGVLLFELLVGKSLHSCHPCGISTHTELSIPTHVSSEGGSLLKQLIQPIPHERLGAGRSGVDEIRSHPFFNGVDWYTVRG